MTTATLDFDNITLTVDQQNGLEAFYKFLSDPMESAFVLEGYSGCGKSTLVSTLLDRLPNFQKTLKLINPSYVEYVPQLTATTNKAAENLSHITGQSVATIHSILGLRVENDFRNNTSTLVPRNNFTKPEGLLLFIDESSFIDKELLGYVFSRTSRCKVVFIGDPAQLIPVKSTNTPVFEAGFMTASLREVVRQAKDNPIVELSTKFRNTVNTGEFFSFKPDGYFIRHVPDREEFKRLIAVEFTRKDWRYADSKILAWTNKCVINFNQFVRNLAKGDPHFQEGDYAVCNSFIALGRQTIKTDQLVQITTIGPDCTNHGVEGNWMTIDHGNQAFQPKSLADAVARAKKARAEGDISLVATIESTWIDLRGAYACTINKSQGSTFGSVFIDLDDVARCNSGDQIARMLYVAVSRAKNHVFMTGNFA